MGNATKIHTLHKEPRFRLRRFTDLAVGSEAVYVVKGLIPRVGITVVWGPPKSGKSFWTFDLVMHVAIGWGYRGRKVQRGAVVYFAFEGAHGFHARAEAFRQSFLPEDHDPFPFYLVDADVRLERDHQQMIADIKSQLGNDEVPVVVVLDTLNRSLGGDENAGKDMTGYINAAGAISAALECAVIVVHHSGHDDSRMRGFSGLGGNTDCQIAVKRDNQSGIISATVVAAKDMPSGDKILSRLRSVVVGTDSDGDPITSCVVDPVDARTPMPRRWTRAMALFRDALAAAIEADGCDHRIGSDGPIVRAVAVDLARAEHRRTYTHDGDGDRTDAERKSWKRSYQKALDLHLIGTAKVGDRDLIWRTDRTDTDSP